MHHFNAAITTAITAARNRERLVRDFLDYRRSAVAEGEKGPVREYVLVPGHDPSRADRLARNLATQGIEVRRAEEAVTIGGRTVPAGAYLVSNAQPSGRLIRNLLDLDTDAVGRVHRPAGSAAPAPPARSDLRHHRVEPAAGLRRRGRDQRRRAGDRDVDAGAGQLRRRAARRAPWPPARSATSCRGARRPRRSRPTRSTQGLRVAERRRRLHAGRARAIRSAPRWCAPPAIPPTCRRGWRRWPTKHGAEVVPIDSAYVESGTSLGSPENGFIKAPRVLLAWDTPTSTLSAGWTRYVLERRFGQAVTDGADGLARPRRLRRLRRAGAAVGQLRRADRRRRADADQGLAAPRRHAGHAGRRHAVGGGSGVGLLDTNALLKDGRPDIPATTGAAPRQRERRRAAASSGTPPAAPPASPTGDGDGACGQARSAA